jgi:hypothetical protein
MRVIVVRKSDSIYLLVDIDRYSGCGVEWRKAERLFYDPCGPSRYDEDGDPLPGSAAHLPLWRPEIQMEPGGRLVMDRSWLMSLPSANVRPLNGNSPVWNQLFNTSRLTDDIGVRSLVPFVVSFSPILPEHTD